MTPCKTDWQKKWLALDCHYEAIQGLATTAENFCKRYYHSKIYPSLLVLVGNPNSGKTHTAKKIYQWANAISMKQREDKGFPEPQSTLFICWPEIVDEFKDGLYGVTKDMINVDLLCIDDIGADHDPSKSAANKFCQVLSRREKKFTVITTNIPVSDWPEAFDARIFDRLFRNSEVIDLFSVPSYALKP